MLSKTNFGIYPLTLGDMRKIESRKNTKIKQPLNKDVASHEDEVEVSTLIHLQNCRRKNKLTCPRVQKNARRLSYCELVFRRTLVSNSYHSISDLCKWLFESKSNRTVSGSRTIFTGGGTKNLIPPDTTRETSYEVKYWRFLNMTSLFKLTGHRVNHGFTDVYIKPLP